MKLSCKKLGLYLSQRLKDQRTLPIRIHVLLDDLNPFLHQQKQVDVFDLLVELILCADIDPTQTLSALLAVLDDEALINLDHGTVANTGGFIRDALQRDSVRWQLQAYHELQKDDHMDVGGRATQEAKAEKKKQKGWVIVLEISNRSYSEQKKGIGWTSITLTWLNKYD